MKRTRERTQKGRKAKCRCQKGAGKIGASCMCLSGNTRKKERARNQAGPPNTYQRRDEKKKRSHGVSISQSGVKQSKGTHQRQNSSAKEETKEDSRNQRGGGPAACGDSRQGRENLRHGVE